jgi:hypothetical protein
MTILDQESWCCAETSSDSLLLVPLRTAGLAPSPAMQGRAGEGWLFAKAKALPPPNLPLLAGGGARIS